MNYNQLINLLPNETELHYREDCTNFFTDNELDPADYTEYKFLIFSETCDYFPAVVDALQNNNIHHEVKKDEWNLKYILIK